MRLQLTTALALFALPAPAQAQFRDAAEPPLRTPGRTLATVDSRAAVHQDTDRTTIITSNTAARGMPSEHVGLEARYLVDMITSASVDVVTAATGAFHEIRHEVQGGVEYHDDSRRFGASYIYSTENDWSSHTANAMVQQDIVRHDVTFRLAGTAVANAVGRADDPNFRRRLTVVGGTTGFTFVPSAVDLLDLGYTISWNDGYQASPYRFVSFSGSPVSPLGFSRPETHPDLRLRHAVTLRWNHHLFTDTAIRSHVRGYVDDWGVKSITAGTEYVVGFGEVETAAFVRGYAQGNADFYAPAYARPMRYMTADRELSSFVDAFGGLRARWMRGHWSVFDDVHLEGKVTAFVFEYSNFPRLAERSGIIGEAALGVAF
jgi:hypothetical protein